MHTDKVVPIYKPMGEDEHRYVEKVEFYPDTPEQSLIDLRLIVLTGKIKNTVSGTFTDASTHTKHKVKDIPYIPLSPDVNLLIGDTWTAVLTYKKREPK